MAPILGTVAGIRRDERAVDWLPAGHEDEPPLEASYLPAAGALPPAPRSTCWFDETDDGHWSYSSPFDTRIEHVCHEQFVGFIGGGGNTLVASEVWRQQGTFGIGTFLPISPSDVSPTVGGLKITTNATGGQWAALSLIEDVITLEDAVAVWMMGRVRLDGTTQRQVHFGMLNDNLLSFPSPVASDRAVSAYFNSAASPANWYLATGKGSGYNTEDTGIAVAANTWYWIDLLVSGDQWAAMWVDGIGPFVSTARVPQLAEANGMQPAMSIAPSNNNARQLLVNQLDVATVTPVVSPVVDE